MKTVDLRTFRTLTVVFLGVGFLLLAFTIKPAQAAFAGQNGKIVFASGRDGNDEIYTMNPGGSGFTQLTHTLYPSGNHDPTFSGDGTKTVFERDGKIWSINADGSGQRRITNGTAYDHDPAFSPDGKKVIFLTRRGADAPPGADNIWVMNADGSGQTRLTSGHNIIHPTYSPTGARIAFVRDDQLWVMNSNGTNQRHYTSANTGSPDTSVAGVESPTWSPSGGVIEFTGIGGVLHCSCKGYFSISAAGGDPTTIGPVDSTYDTNLAFSPDGTRIALTSNRNDGNNEIYTQNPNGSGPANITNNPASDRQPDWGVTPRQQSTSLNLSTSPITLIYGHSTTLSGRLLTQSGNVYAGQRVMIQQKPVDAKSFSNLKAVSTNYNGAFKLALKPAKNTYYRAVYTRNNTLKLGNSASAAKLVRVKVRVTENVSTTSVKLGKSLVISGVIGPSHNGYVKLTIRRNGALLTTKKAPLNSSSYRLAYKPPRAGSYSVVASYANDADHLGNVSLARKFKVIR